MHIAPDMAEALWAQHFTFAGVIPDEWEKKEAFWKRSALETVEFITHGTNPTLRIDTGVGKTVIALLAAVVLGARTLFLTPTRYLAGQHQELLTHVLGATLPSRVITGETRASHRVWGRGKERFVFATGSMFSSALATENVSPEVFDLVIFDEMHHATRRYPYVGIARVLERFGIPRLGLTASPGSTQEEVDSVLMNAGCGRAVSLFCPTPRKHEDYSFVPLSPEMERSDECGWKPLGALLLQKLQEDRLLHIPEHMHTSARALGALCFKVNALPTTRRTKRLRKIFAEYRLYLYGRHVFLTGSYHSFLSYAEKLAVRKRPSDRMLLGEPLFRRLIVTARTYRDEHPKVLALVRILKRVAHTGGRAIVFFADRETALYCKQFLSERGVETETVFGGAEKSLAKQRKTIHALRDGALVAVLATSVIHEGVSIPEVDLVVHYSVATSSIIRLQGNGRTGRVRSGQVIHLVLDHDLDRQMFFSVHTEMKRMLVLAQEESLFENSRGQRSLFVS